MGVMTGTEGWGTGGSRHIPPEKHVLLTIHTVVRLPAELYCGKFSSALRDSLCVPRRQRHTRHARRVTTYRNSTAGRTTGDQRSTSSGALRTGGCPGLMEPETPIIIATNAAGGGISFSREERERHLYIVGKSGSGKSTVLFNLAMHDIIVECVFEMPISFVHPE